MIVAGQTIQFGSAGWIWTGFVCNMYRPFMGWCQCQLPQAGYGVCTEYTYTVLIHAEIATISAFQPATFTVGVLLDKVWDLPKITWWSGRVCRYHYYACEWEKSLSHPAMDPLSNQERHQGQTRPIHSPSFALGYGHVCDKTYRVKWILDGATLRGELPRLYPFKEVRAIPYAEFWRSMYPVICTP